LAEVRTTDSGEVGKSIEADGWVVTLADQPEQRKKVGSGAGDAREEAGPEGRGRTGTREAEGIWLILTIELSNETGDLALLPMKLLTIVDSQGSRYALQGMTIHAPLIHADERWEGIENQLVQNVLETDVIYGGPLVYDVPEDATGLKLVMEGTDETIDLGF
jgi:hypothetical protein